MKELLKEVKAIARAENWHTGTDAQRVAYSKMCTELYAPVVKKENNKAATKKLTKKKGK